MSDKQLTGVAIDIETREKVAKFRDENDCKSYDAAINLLFDLIENLFQDIEKISETTPLKIVCHDSSQGIGRTNANPLVGLAGLLCESAWDITTNEDELSLYLAIKCETMSGFVGTLHLLEIFRLMKVDGVG